jgi:tetratricopeptide (TPR) repeat protein
VDRGQRLEQWAQALITDNFAEEASFLFRSLAMSGLNVAAGTKGLAEIAERQWRWQEAIDHWEVCLSSAEAQLMPQIIAKRAHCLVQLGRLPEAKDLLQSVSADFEGVQGLALIAGVEESPVIERHYWQECMMQWPDRIEGHLGLGKLLLNQGRFVEAEGVLATAVATWPEHSEARVLWGVMATLDGKWHIATDRWNYIMREFPHDRKVRRGYANYLGNVLGREQADSYAAILSQDPIAAAEFLLEYSVSADDWEVAVAKSEDLLRLSGRRPTYLLLHSIILLECPRRSAEHLQQALAILEFLRAHWPDAVEVIWWSVEALLRAGMHEQTIELIREIPAKYSPHSSNVCQTILASSSSGRDFWKELFFGFNLVRRPNWRWFDRRADLLYSTD